MGPWTGKFTIVSVYNNKHICIYVTSGIVISVNSTNAPAGYHRARIYKTSKRLHMKPSVYKFEYAGPPLILFLHTVKLNHTKE